MCSSDLAIVRFVGGTVPDALATSRRMREITIGENNRWPIPVLDFAGAATGIDVTSVCRTGILPQINTGMAGKVAEISGRGVKASGKRVLGDPATQLVDLAHDTADSLTVMSTHGRSGVARTLLGSVADKVVRSSGRPVLLVRVS